MQINLLSKYLPKEYQRDLFHMVLFGLLSIVFARIKFQIMGFEDIESNFREIPLLISLFYIRNPLYLIGLSVISTIYAPGGVPYILNSGMHTISILGAWGLYYYFDRNINNFIFRIFAWGFITFLYYALFIIPLFLTMGYLIGYLPELSFIKNYFEFHKLLQIEGITTILITVLYFMQLEIRRALMEHKLNLEQVVEQRTRELALTNDRLLHVNENLDILVKERSDKIEEQFNLMIRYAHMNSHDVRAPLARILGLIELIKINKSVSDKDNLVDKLYKSGEELDVVVKKMNRLLEEQITPNENT